MQNMSMEKARTLSVISYYYNQLYYIVSYIMSAEFGMFHCIITNKTIDSNHNYYAI